MKNLVTILLVLLSLNVGSQSSHYELHSKIWEIDYSGKIAMLHPIGSDEFRGDLFDTVIKQLDLNKVKSHLLTSFNEFRKDYNSLPVIQDTDLTIKCENYVKKLPSNFNHDTNLDGKTCECILYTSLYFFTPIKRTDGDFNKIVADSIFDSFVDSNPHMKILLSNDAKKVGFGVYISGEHIYVVFRSIK
jgi:hypothetical protein